MLIQLLVFWSLSSAGRGEDIFFGIKAIEPVTFEAPEIPSSMTGSIADYKQPNTTPTLPLSMVQNVTTTTQKQGAKTTSYGDVYITAPNGITPDQLAEWDELNAG